MNMPITPGLLIALSAGGNWRELALEGVGEEHIEELCVRISMQLLSDGHRIAYGGTLGFKDYPITQHLIGVAQNWLEENTAKEIDVNIPDTWPLVNYSAWPYYQTIDLQTRASRVGICQFRDIDPVTCDKRKLSRLSSLTADDPNYRRFASDALTEMRIQTAVDSDLRILCGGKIRGALGWLPGVYEEFVSTLQVSKPAIIVGGYGGCAKVIADFLASPTASWPAELNFDPSADEPRNDLLAEKELAELKERVASAQSLVEQFRTDLHFRPTVNGLESRLVSNLLFTQNTRKIIRGIDAAISQILKDRV